MITAPVAIGTPIVGDSINGNLTVTGWGSFTNGVDWGPNGEVLCNWHPADPTNPVATATFDVVPAQGAFLWRDTITAAPTARNKMKLDPYNALTLYKSDGTEGLLIDPQNGKITVLAPGANSGIFFGTNTIPTLKAATNGFAVFPSQVTLQGGLLLSAGSLQVSATTPATSSTSGALTVAGGIGVGTDSYFNGVRVGRGAGNVSINTVTGTGALGTNTTGVYNSAFGAYALRATTIGSSNTASGTYALYSNISGKCNTASGTYALYANTAQFNTASGAFALYANTTGKENTASGSYALYANTTGYDNTASGLYAMGSNTTGYGNTTAGACSLYANTTGTGNTAVGYQAAYPNTLGSNNVSVGSYAAYYQANGSTTLTDPENSVYIGAYVRGRDNNDSNSIVIGANAIGEGANTTVIGSSATTKTHLYGGLVASTATLGGLTVTANASGGNALVVEGHTLLKGKVIIEQVQGDISMGIYGDN